MSSMESAKIRRHDGNKFYISSKIPDNLATVVESLTREVIRHRPENIYIFATHHFEKLLQLRQKQHVTTIHDNSMIISLPKSHKRLYYQQRQFSDGEIMKSPPIVITGMHAKDIKTEMRKNKLTSREKNYNYTKNDAALANLNINKVKNYVINKFATSANMEEIKKIHYIPKVQTIIDTATPIINNKIEILKNTCKINENHDDDFNKSRYLLESQLNETCNLLKDISTCFTNNSNVRPRPHSADSAAHINSTDQLKAMLNETHNLLLDISSNFFQPNISHENTQNNNDTNIINITTSLPAVTSPLPQTLTKNFIKNDSLPSSSFVALPPVVSSSAINSTMEIQKSVKTKQNLILPELAIPRDNKNNAYTSHLNYDNDQQRLQINKIITSNEKCYILADADDKNIHHDIPDDITTVIIPDKATTNIKSITDSHLINNKNDPYNNVLGHQIVTPMSDDDNIMLAGSLFELATTINSKNKFNLHKQDILLQCINEEDPTEQYLQVCNTESDVSLESSSAKETSATDTGIIENPQNYHHYIETAPIISFSSSNSSSASTDIAESSNEAKETTLTDGISLSLDDLTRPFVPELNLDSLQDLTISSFKIPENDEHHQQPTDDDDDDDDDDDHHEDTNSITETSTISLCRQTSYNNEDNDELTKSKITYNFTTSPTSSIVNVENNPQFNLISAVILLQAGVRGFLVRRHRVQTDQQHIQSTNLNNYVSPTTTIIAPLTEPRFLNLKENTSIIQQQTQEAHHHGMAIDITFKSNILKKRLYRENAIQQSTTNNNNNNNSISIEKLIAGPPPTTTIQYDGLLQHTGEFHDCIPLSIFDNIKILIESSSSDTSNNDKVKIITMSANNYDIMFSDNNHATTTLRQTISQLTPTIISDILNIMLLTADDKITTQSKGIIITRNDQYLEYNLVNKHKKEKKKQSYEPILNMLLRKIPSYFPIPFNIHCESDNFSLRQQLSLSQKKLSLISSNNDCEKDKNNVQSFLHCQSTASTDDN